MRRVTGCSTTLLASMASGAASQRSLEVLAVSCSPSSHDIACLTDPYQPQPHAERAARHEAHPPADPPSAHHPPQRHRHRVAPQPPARAMSTSAWIAACFLLDGARLLRSEG